MLIAWAGLMAAHCRRLSKTTTPIFPSFYVYKGQKTWKLRQVEREVEVKVDLMPFGALQFTSFFLSQAIYS